MSYCPPMSPPPGDVAGGCKLLRNRFESRDREWASYTCVLGFHVFGGCRWGGRRGVSLGWGVGPSSTVCVSPPPGVWPDGSDGTDINSLCRSHHERLVAVADDFCKVHLFQYPCARPKVGWGGGHDPQIGGVGRGRTPKWGRVVEPLNGGAGGVGWGGEWTGMGGGGGQDPQVGVG